MLVPRLFCFHESVRKYQVVALIMLHYLYTTFVSEMVSFIFHSKPLLGHFRPFQLALDPSDQYGRAPLPKIQLSKFFPACWLTISVNSKNSRQLRRDFLTVGH